MRKGPALENLATAMVETCRSGLDLETLRATVLPRLRRAVPVDAVWWATVDPATLLFTRGYREEIPEETGPYLVENEFLGDDPNKWTELAHDGGGVRTLLEATGGDLTKSARYRDVFQPLGLEDELRAVLRSRDTCWGYLCLHREGPSAFSREETAFVRRIAPHLADGIRIGLLIENARIDQNTGAPGLVLLAHDGSVLGTNPPAEQWLDELREPASDHMLPIEIYAVAASLRRATNAGSAQPQLRLRTRAGRWVVLHASWMSADNRDTVAIIIEPAAALEIAPLVMAAHGLTARERTVTGLVCQGYSTAEIASQLYVTANTVQDHLKSIFDKTGVRSRRELVATILKQDYLPGVRAERPIGASGFFR
jgi:DNA-binding CsgD family transcriptional regulator